MEDQSSTCSRSIQRDHEDRIVQEEEEEEETEEALLFRQGGPLVRDDSGSWDKEDALFLEERTIPTGSSICDSLPPQLHPAVSRGMRRVSSCYFSIQSTTPSEASNSVADLLSLLEQEDLQQQQQDINHHHHNNSSDLYLEEENHHHDNHNSPLHLLDVLHHDVIMCSLTFLQASDLAAFSETARRCNFECFYFLQLRLQRTLLNKTFLLQSDALAGAGCLTRLAHLDRKKAEAIVEGYNNSNSSLNRMPLSHSLAYIRHFLTNHGFLSPAQNHPPGLSGTMASKAALLITLVGAASFLSSQSSPEVANLFKVGLASLMGFSAQRHRLEETFPKATAEQLARLLRHHSSTFTSETDKPNLSNSPSSQAGLDPMTPYQHLPPEKEEGHPSKEEEESKVPSGCVGAYSRAVRRATLCVAQHIKEDRNARFQQLSVEEQQQVALDFLHACTSDNLPVVKEIVQTRNMINVDGFYVGPDGTDTCALHAAAFSGSCQVLDFLCAGIHEMDASRDGGLCNVNLRDENAWTAMHFCAGANCVEAIRILVRYGADPSVEATNGYTPFHWAKRLSNMEAADELSRFGADHFLKEMWFPSMIASRFFALIPTR